MLRKWNEQEIAAAVECLKKGMSAGATAKQMSEQGWRKDVGGISRNAVIGVWSRNADTSDPSIVINRGRITLPQSRPKKVQSKANIYLSKQEVPEDGYQFHELVNGVCRFPFGDPDTEAIRYCGHPVDYSRGHSYCAKHYALCYYPTRTK
jgi:hypothetical protein